MGGCQQAVTPCSKVQLIFYSTFEVLDLPGSGLTVSDEHSSRCEVVRALSNAHLLCGTRRQCAGTSAFDALVSQQKLYTDHPALFS